MKKIVLVIVMFLFTIVQHGQIVADHTVVDSYDDIPQYYIDKVKKMLLIVASESHGNGYMNGLVLLEGLYPAYNVHYNSSGAPSAYTDANLRICKMMWGDYSNPFYWAQDYGEEDWFTNQTAISRTKAGITYINETHGTTIGAVGFGWCYDALTGSGTVGTDPVTGNRWYGNSLGGPDGDKPWGIDAADFAVTGNSVSMDSYLSATQEYIDYCTAHGYPTKVFFTTGPVDAYSSEARYAAYLGYEHIRNYVRASSTRILFDYADILCYDDNGALTTDIWNGHTIPAISATNQTPISQGHISDAGAIRLAKAMWWMLARMTGWDGGGLSSLLENSNQEAVDIQYDYYLQGLRINASNRSLEGTLELYNMNGQLIQKDYINKDVVFLKTTSLFPGLYCVYLRGKGFYLTRKLILIPH